jgi:HSP20 family protein
MAKEEKKSGKEIEERRPARVLTPFEEMDRLFEGFFPRGWMRPFHMAWPTWGEMGASLDARVPKVDVIDREGEVVVRAEVPGVEKDDLDVSVSDNAVTIKGKTKREEKEEKGDYYHCEISSAAFARTVPLPSNVDSEKVTARFKDGVLELTMPKVEKAKRRSVKID